MKKYNKSLLLTGLVLVGCQTKAADAPARPEPTPAVTTSGEVTYDAYVKTWLNRQCVSCHKPGGSSPDLTTYELARANAAKILASIQSLDNPMPPNGPTPSQDVVDKIRAWIKAGRPKGSTAATGQAPAENRPAGSAAVASAVTYSSYVRGWLTQQCTVCHRAGATPPDLSTYQGAAAAAQRSLSLIRGNDPAGIMPPNGRPASPEVLSKIESWIKAGMPER